MIRVTISYQEIPCLKQAFIVSSGIYWSEMSEINSPGSKIGFYIRVPGEYFCRNGQTIIHNFRQLTIQNPAPAI